MERDLSTKKRFQHGKRAFMYWPDEWQFFSSLYDHFLVFSFPFHTGITQTIFAL
jgi:hypothetical protein